MTSAAHLIHADTPVDMLHALASLRRDDEPVICLGPAPACRVVPITRQVHLPLGQPALCVDRMLDIVPTGGVIHGWGLALASATSALASVTQGRGLLSLPHLPARKQARTLPWTLAEMNLHVTLPTRRAMDWLIATGADPARVHHLTPVGLAGEFSTSLREQTRQALGLVQEQVLIAAVTEMRPGSGHDQVCWAHAIARHVQPNGRVIIPGTGPTERHVKFFSATTGFTHEVHFTGDRFDHRAVLAAADLAAFLHVHDCGLTGPAQALTAGVAVLASTTPDLMELLDDQTALHVAPTPQRESAAAIVRLIEEPRQIERLAEAAKRAGQAHRPDRVRPRLEEIYESLYPG